MVGNWSAAMYVQHFFQVLASKRRSYSNYFETLDLWWDRSTGGGIHEDVEVWSCFPFSGFEEGAGDCRGSVSCPWSDKHIFNFVKKWRGEGHGHHSCRRPVGMWTSKDSNRYWRTSGQIWCHSFFFFLFVVPNHEQDHLKDINVYIALLFSPVPLTGCLRAYRFYFTSLLANLTGPSFQRADSPNASRRAQKKKNVCTYQWLHNFPAPVQKRGSSIYVEQTCKKVGSKASHRTAFLGTLSRNTFPIDWTFVSAKHFQFCVPSLFWASGNDRLEVGSTLANVDAGARATGDPACGIVGRTCWGAHCAVD